MVNWEKLTLGTSKIVLYRGDADSLPEIDAFKEMWRLTLEEIIPLNSSVSWDYIKIELWPDSGRVIVYPASSQNAFRIEKATCQIFFPSLLQESERIDNEYPIDLSDNPPEDDESEALFEQAVTELELEWIRKAVEAAQIQIPRGRGLKLEFYSSGDSEPLYAVTM